MDLPTCVTPSPKVYYNWKQPVRGKVPKGDTTWPRTLNKTAGKMEEKLLAATTTLDLGDTLSDRTPREAKLN